MDVYDEPFIYGQIVLFNEFVCYLDELAPSPTSNAPSVESENPSVHTTPFFIICGIKRGGFYVEHGSHICYFGVLTLMNEGKVT